MSEVDTATLAELATQRQAESIFATVLDVDTFINCTCVPSSACEAAVAASQANQLKPCPPVRALSIPRCQLHGVANSQPALTL